MINKSEKVVIQSLLQLTIMGILKNTGARDNNN